MKKVIFCSNTRIQFESVIEKMNDINVKAQIHQTTTADEALKLVTPGEPCLIVCDSILPTKESNPTDDFSAPVAELVTQSKIINDECQIFLFATSIYGLNMRQFTAYVNPAENLATLRLVMLIKRYCNN